MRWLLIPLFILYSSVSFAQTDELIYNSQTNYFVLDSAKEEFEQLNYYLEIFEDTTNSLNIDQVSSYSFYEKFKPYPKFEQPLYAKNTYWGRISIANHLLIDKEWIMYLGIANFAEVYFPKVNGGWNEYHTGRLTKGSQKTINQGRDCVIPIILKHIERPITIYIKLKSIDNRPPVFQLNLQTRKKWDMQFLERNIFQGLFQGVLWILIIYHLITYFLVRNVAYLYYSVYMVLAAIYYLAVNGFLTETILSELPEMNEYIWIITIYTIGLVYFQFMRSFFELKKRYPIWNKIIKFWIIFKVVMITAFLSIVFTTFNIGTPNRIATTIAIIEPFLSLAFVFAMVIAYLKKDKKLLGSALYVLSGAALLNLFMAVNLSYVALNHSAKNDTTLIQIGICFELLFFAIGLGYKERELQKETHEMQENLIAQLKENERLKTEANKILEQKVKERTYEIQHKNEQIEKTNQLLQIKQNELLVQNEELEQQQEEIMAQRDFIEMKNTELKYQNDKITDSIRYAQTIQQAILPNKAKMKACFEDFFIVFRPKDIVSGDIYWLTQTEKYSFLATVDCTGHGVPGAFMSLIANTLLNEIVGIEGIFETSEILAQLHQKIIKSLRQDENANADGMDVCLCRIEKDGQFVNLVFSGAKRPLYYSQAHSKKLEELKGDIKSIGGIRRVQKVFEQNSTRIALSSTIYLTTDGLIDQNSPENEKFGTPRLLDILKNCCHLPLTEQQRRIEQALDHHKLNNEQRDDITVLGVRI